MQRIVSMLSIRIIQSDLGDRQLARIMSRGKPRGGCIFRYFI